MGLFGSLAIYSKTLFLYINLKMSADEDEKEYELKDLLVQIMEANGTWPKMRVITQLTNILV